MVQAGLMAKAIYVNQARALLPEQISEEAIAMLGTGQHVPPFTERHNGFDLAEAYEVVARVRDSRQARGEIPMARPHAACPAGQFARGTLARTEARRAQLSEDPRKQVLTRIAESAGVGPDDS